MSKLAKNEEAIRKNTMMVVNDVNVWNTPYFYVLKKNTSQDVDVKFQVQHVPGEIWVEGFEKSLFPMERHNLRQIFPMMGYDGLQTRPIILELFFRVIFPSYLKSRVMTSRKWVFKNQITRDF